MRPTLRPPTPLVFILGLGFALQAFAQSPILDSDGFPIRQGGFIFDIFDYDAHESDEDAFDEYETVIDMFRSHDWYRGNDSLTTYVAWYRESWKERRWSDPDNARIGWWQDGWAGGPHFIMKKGHPAGPGLHSPMIVSGFTARTGTWYARLNYSPLPDKQFNAVMHTFWMMSPFTANFSEVRTEFNFEWHNWMPPSMDFPYMRSVFFEETAPPPISPLPVQTMSVPARDGSIVGSGIEEYTCTLQYRPEDGGELYHLPIELCNGAVTKRLRCDKTGPGPEDVICRLGEPDPDVWIHAFIQHRGSSMRYSWWTRIYVEPIRGGSAIPVALYAHSKEIAPESGRLPSQDVSTIFSIRNHGYCEVQTEQGECPGESLDATMSMKLDWFYFTPDRNINIWDAQGDVEQILIASQGQTYKRRINTTELDLNRPEGVLPSGLPPSSGSDPVRGGYGGCFYGQESSCTKSETMLPNTIDLLRSVRPTCGATQRFVWRPPAFATWSGSLAWRVTEFYKGVEVDLHPYTDETFYFSYACSSSDVTGAVIEAALRHEGQKECSVAPCLDAPCPQSDVQTCYNLDHEFRSCVLLDFINGTYYDCTFDDFKSDEYVARFTHDVDSDTASRDEDEHQARPDVAPVDNSITFPTYFSVSSNHPNPFSVSTTVQYGLPEDAHITLTILDGLGRVVDIIIDDVVPAGYHEVLVDGSGWSSGLYFYRLDAVGLTSGSRHSRTLQMTLVR